MPSQVSCCFIPSVILTLKSGNPLDTDDAVCLLIDNENMFEILCCFTFVHSQSLSSLDGQDDEDDSDSADNISISSMDGRDAVGPSSPGHTSLSMAAACTMEEVANAERGDNQKGMPLHQYEIRRHSIYYFFIILYY